MTRTQLCTTIDAEIKEAVLPILYERKESLSSVIEQRLKEIILTHKRKKNADN